jgi:peptidoglycan lytic transglycosylase D
MIEVPGMTQNRSKGALIRIVWASSTLGLSLVAACGSAKTAGVALQSAPVLADHDIQSLIPPAALDDSAADAEALAEMRALEFGSLSKGGGHVRGVVTPPDEDDLESMWLMGAQSRGGPAGLDASSFDLDVETYVSHRRVQFYREYFTGQAHSRFAIWLGRMARYEGMVQQVFRLYGLPQDLIYLGLVESGYSNTAISRANAVGMWQFMASTARRYGLRIDGWVDERRDPFRATDAAARHLADLRDQFGSWYLAAAAYNAGAGRVSRGLRRLNTDDAASDEAYFELSSKRYLRPETRDYVPKLIAATVIAKDQYSLGFTDTPKLEPLIFDEITVPSQTGLDVIASLADTTDRAIMELNPKYYRGATPPRERAVVRVPRGKGTEVLKRYAELPVEERLNFVEHRISRGETLGGIAKQYRVSVRAIQAANPGIQPRRLQVGQVVTIPVSPSAQAASVTRPRTRTRPAPSAPSSGVYRVRSGDSLWEIARKYGVSVSQLRRWNQIPENVTLLTVGEQLRVSAPR